MEKHEQAIQEVLDHYISQATVTMNKDFQNDIDNQIYDSQNPYMWTGQFFLAIQTLGLPKNDLLDIMFFTEESFITRHLYRNTIRKGLFTRYPHATYLNSPHFDSISFDEHAGLSFFLAKDLTKHIIDYGDAHNNIFDEKNPDGVKFSLKEIWKALTTITKVIKFGIQNKDYGGSGRMDQIIFESPLLTHLTRYKLPKDMGYLRIAVGDRASLIQTLHLAVTMFNTVRKGKKSGLNFILYRFIMFKKVGYNPFWVKYLRKKYLQRTDLRSVFEEFYPKDHPFVDLNMLLIEKLKGEL